MIIRVLYVISCSPDYISAFLLKHLKPTTEISRDLQTEAACKRNVLLCQLSVSAQCWLMSRGQSLRQEAAIISDAARVNIWMELESGRGNQCSSQRKGTHFDLSAASLYSSFVSLGKQAMFSIFSWFWRLLYSWIKNIPQVLETKVSFEL